MLAELPENSIELDGLLMGPSTKVMVENVDFGFPSIVQVDKQLPRSDGQRFGRDYRGGRNIIITMHVFADNGPDAMQAISEMATKWLADDIRDSPGAVSTLRYRTGNRQRRVYGRPRKFAPVSLRANANGWAPVTAEFVTIDHKYYADQEHSNTVSIIPPPAGGYFSPFYWPLTSVAISYAPGVITVGGDAPTWPVFIVRGPIADPEIRVVDEWTLSFPNLFLFKNEFLAVDPRPWSRGVRKNGIVNASGALSAYSPRLSQTQLSPGVHEVVLSGFDPTGTADMTVAWREVYNNF